MAKIGELFEIHLDNIHLSNEVFKLTPEFLS